MNQLAIKGRGNHGKKRREKKPREGKAWKGEKHRKRETQWREAFKGENPW